MTSATVAPRDLEPARGAREQGDQRARQVDDAPGPHGAHQPTTAASTDQIGGRLSAISDQVRPSSALP